MEPIDKEEWRPIKDFDNYEVSDLGNIRHRRLGPLRLSTHRSGGQHVRLCDGSHHRRDCLVHRLVAQAFVPQPEGKHCVTHLNGDKGDNRATNLRWTTEDELGEPSKQVEASRDEDFASTAMTFDSIGEATRHGLERSGVSSACHGRFPRYKGYYWRFKRTPNVIV